MPLEPIPTATSGARVRVPLPAWMLAWPRGLVPSAAHACAREVQLHYTLRDGTHLELALRLVRAAVRVDVREGPGLESNAVPPRAREAMRAALCRRLATGQARAWIHAVTASADALGEVAEDRAPPEASVIEALAEGQLARALELWSRHAAAITRRARLPGTAGTPAAYCAALICGVLGLPRAGRDFARRDTVDEPRHAQALGSALLHLGAPADALGPLAWAVHHGGQPSARFELARAAALARRPEVAEAALDGPAAPDETVAIVEALIHADAFEAAEARLVRALEAHPDHPGLNACHARAMLWHGDLEAAAARLDHLRQIAPERPVHALAGPLAVLRGEHAQAAAELDAARAGPRPPRGDALGELKLWHAQALLHTGDYARAYEDVIHQPFRRCHALAHLLQTAIEVRMLDGELRGDMPTIIRIVLEDLAVAVPPDASNELLAELALAAVDQFGGNRSQFPTRVVPDPNPNPDPKSARRPTRLVRVHDNISPRGRAVELQELLFTEAPERVVEAFEALARRYPSSPFPITYGAEVNLWLGRYERAAEQYEGVVRSCGTRWAYIGAGAAWAALGESDRALERWDASFRLHAPLAHVATYAYRGELWRRLGEAAKARADLEHAQRHAPARVGPTLNLALLDLAEGHARAPQTLARACAKSPVLIWAASGAAGLPATLNLDAEHPRTPAALEAALAMLRGNRSSTIYTFFDGEERLRVMAPRHLERWRRVADEDGRVLARDARVHAWLARSSTRSTP